MSVILWDLVTGNAAGSYTTVAEAIMSLSDLARDHGPEVLDGYGVELHHDDGTVTAVPAGAFVASTTYYDDSDFFAWDEERDCMTCGGDGYGYRGYDFRNDDPVNEPDGKLVRCPNCRGSGLAKDQQFW